MTKEISNAEDIIDSRDVIARVEELEASRDALSDAVDNLRTAEESSDIEAIKAALELRDLAELDFGETEDAELAALKAFAEEAAYSPDWVHGGALIRDSYFQEYAQELAEDIGAIGRDATWPNDYIDWERATDALKMDYHCVDFDGVEYWIRS